MTDAEGLGEAQIQHMVDRFLGWRLPESFSPDNGISFKATFNDHLPRPTKREPRGTNLLDAAQAADMVRHMVEGLPRAEAHPPTPERVARIIANLRSRANAAHGRAPPSETALMCADAADLLESLSHGRPARPAEGAPIPMVLFCPACGHQHIDKSMVDEVPVRLRGLAWDNPPHRSHLCQGCGHTWRPADVPTEGVAAIETRGKNDSPAAGVRACVNHIDRRSRANLNGDELCQECADAWVRGEGDAAFERDVQEGEAHA